MDHGHTLLGRAHTELDTWLERDLLKGGLALVGAMWGQDASWGPDPESAAYADNRWAWHQNLGELLNFHGTAHIKNQNVSGVVKKRLAVTLSHPDPARLEAVKVVAGGTVEAHRYAAGVSRLRIFDRGAALVLKCGRLFADPANLALFDVLNVAGRFYTHVPDPGVSATEPQMVGMEEEEAHLIALLNDYRARGPVSHDCATGIGLAGGGSRPTEGGFFR